MKSQFGDINEILARYSFNEELFSNVAGTWLGLDYGYSPNDDLKPGQDPITFVEGPPDAKPIKTVPVPYVPGPGAKAPAGSPVVPIPIALPVVGPY